MMSIVVTSIIFMLVCSSLSLLILWFATFLHSKIVFSGCICSLWSQSNSNNVFANRQFSLSSCTTST